MNFILYHPKVAKTGRLLQTVLGIKGGTEAPDEELDNLIRWGCLRNASTKNQINHPDAIKAASHKYEAMVKMHEAGVKVPKFSKTCEGVNFPAVVRNNVHHGGQGFGLILQKRDIGYWERRGISDYYIEYIPCRTEYRVHVWDGKILRIQKKQFSPKDLNKQCLHRARFIRNHSNGWSLNGVKLANAPDNVQQNALKAVSALNLAFGAVDVIVCDSGDAHVLEVNTAPGLLSRRSLTRYTEKFADWLGIPKTPEFYEAIRVADISEQNEEIEIGETT